MFVEEFQDDGHYHWQISRPERFNALGVSIAKELTQKMTVLKKKIAANPRAAVKPRTLTISARSVDKGSGSVWIAGGDLKELAKLKTKAQATQYAKSLSNFCANLENLPIPVIALIDGAALGGGAELALAADIRLASRNSSFVFKQLEIGLTAGYGSTKRIVELFGRANAQKLFYLGEAVSALQAYEFGLVHILCDSNGELEAKLHDLRQHFASLNASTFAAQKRLILEVPYLAADKARSSELRAFSEVWRNPFHAKFLEKFNAAKK